MARGILGFIGALICILGIIVVILASVFVSLPDVGQLKDCMITQLHKVRLCERESSYAQLTQISPFIIGAVIMSEDAAFYSHNGIDMEEMKESIIADMNKMRFARGASTITQQLVKNVFLTDEKTLTRKIKEIYLATQVEKMFSKAKILTSYLNVVELGPNIFGVKAATQYYFQKSPSDVTPEEAAFLAFLLPNPKKYHQSFAKKQLTPFASKMIKTILHKMNKGRKITDEEFQGALSRVAYFPWTGTESSGLPGGEDLSGESTNEENMEDNDFQYDFSTEEGK